MQPKYNSELFKQYPKSEDGLYKNKIDIVTYTFADPITLIYDKGEIQGGLSSWGGDTILITANNKSELVKFKTKKF